MTEASRRGISIWATLKGSSWLTLGLAWIVSLLVFSYSTLNRTSFTGSLEPQYNDHLRHQRYAWEFLQKGIPVIFIPMKQLERIGPEAYYSWPEVAYPYPVGALLLFAGPAMLSFGGALQPELVNKLTVVLLLLFAHLDLCLLWRQLEAYSKGAFRPLNLILFVFFYLLLILWSLNGQYDAVPLFFILLASLWYSKGKVYLVIVALTLAFFLKYQAFLYLPFAISSWLKLIWGVPGCVAKPSNARLSPLINLCLVLGSSLFIFGFNLATFLFSYLWSNMGFGNPLQLWGSSPTPGIVAAFLMIVLTTASLSVFMFVSKERVLAFVILLASAGLILSPWFQGWYILWYFPLLSFAPQKHRAWIGLWIFGLFFGLGWTPHLGYLVDLFVNAWH